MVPYTADISHSFPGYWVVARELMSGTPPVRLYDVAYLDARLESQGFPADRMFGPPTLALTLAPLAWLPYTTARAAWLVGVLWPLLMASLASLFAPLGAPGLLLAAAFALGQPTAANMAVGQTYPLMLALHCVALRGWRAGRPWHSAAGLAPMIALRGWYGLPQAAGWLVSGRPAGLVAAGAATLAIVALTLPLLTVEAWQHFLTVQLPSAGSEHAMALAYQTWRSLALHLTTAHPTLSPDPPLAGLGAGLWLAGAAVFASVTVWAARRGGQRPVVFGLWTVAALLLAPVAEDHHMILTALPAALLWRHGRAAKAAVLAAMVLLLPDWGYDRPTLLGGWRSVLGYPRLGGVLILWAASVWAALKPDLDTTIDMSRP